ncbi:GATA transcription factor 15-like [Nicotiana tabacum]|uniref:GATA transcription factor 15-like n=2 Tax=Nicotiana TaxID=4085 RepID=A0A1S4DB30_TOBAC|nr:PREDICTED: GATA transcription factor 15-like isoform X1 [Nicotiana sylvestris]XP_016510622.1 PREDICTED: GATA transcription factor 15-like [Nicotiana tabacum]
MVDFSDKVSDHEVAENEEMKGQNQTPERVLSENSESQLKTCVDCGTTKTPLWRGGPAGPKSLCNACGIRSRKKRRALLGLNKEDKKPKKSMGSSNKSASQHHNQNNQSSNSSTSSSEESTTSNAVKNNKCIPFKKRLLHFGREVALQRPRSSSTQHRRKLGEEEQAAFLLMALSCGSVYA